MLTIEIDKIDEAEKTKILMLNNSLSQLYNQYIQILNQIRLIPIKNCFKKSCELFQNSLRQNCNHLFDLLKSNKNINLKICIYIFQFLSFFIHEHVLLVFGIQLKNDFCIDVGDQLSLEVEAYIRSF